MFLSPVLLGAALALGVCACPALSCSLALSTGGTLALSGDASRLDSTVAGGSGAVVTILNLDLGAATITVAAPTLHAYPGGFNPGTSSVTVAYAGGGLLNGVSQGFTPNQTQFQVPALLGVATALTVHNRLETGTGFSTGTYMTRTVITCS
jgi:hypothetical protein